MILNSFQINDAMQMTPLAPEKTAEACQSKDARIWVDLQAAEPGEIEAWLDKLEVTGLSRQLCLEARDRSGYYPLKKEILLVLPALFGTEGLPEVDHLALLCRENLLLTLHGKPILNPQQLASIHEADAWLPDLSIAGLVSAMMMDLSQECLRHIDNLKHSILVLEKRMDREPETVEAEEILDMRSNLLVHEAMLTWIVFGTAVIWKAYELFSWQAVVYAVMSLTVVRMVPTFLSLTGTGESTDNKLFLGWFGPRGLASIVLAIIVLNTTLPGAERMAVVVICAVMLSALAHGLTANPLASALVRRNAGSAEVQRFDKKRS